MNIQHLLLVIMTLIYSTHAYSMKRLDNSTTNDQVTLNKLKEKTLIALQAQYENKLHTDDITDANDQTSWLTIPEDIWTYIIAHHHIKDDLRKICTYLHKLASRSNEELLKHSDLVLSEKVLERTVLYYTELGNSAIVRNLLAKGANPNVYDANGNPLNFQICGNEIQKIKNWEDANPNENKMTLLHYASQYGYIDIVNMLLEHPDLITDKLINGFKSPFWQAIVYNHNAVVERFISTYTIDTSQWALCYAIQKGRLDTVRILLDHNVSANSTDKNDCPPLISAIDAQHASIMDFLITKGANVHCQYGHNESPYAGFTPLHYAAANGFMQGVQILLKHGAQVNQKARNKKTPLHCASEHGHVRIVEILLNHGANINQEAHYKRTPLHYACIKGPSRIVEMLLIKGAFVNQKTKENETPLHYASSAGHAFIVKVLLNYGAEVNVTTDYGQTPLHYASQQRDVQMIKMLLNNKAEINTINGLGNTPLDLAYTKDTQQLLITHGGKRSNELKKDKLKQNESDSYSEEDGCIIQ